MSDGFIIENGVLIRYAGNGAQITVPEQVREIGQKAFFMNHHIKSITFPDGTERIGDYAFADCHGLENITLPDSLTVIGEFAFAGCSSLREAYLSKNLEKLGASAFRNCTALTSVALPPVRMYMSPDAQFENCGNLRNVTVLENDMH